ncbi:MAG: bifunctional phosphoglucose/phosphomannose isomerase [Candidatus Aenigmarchaeota archaeon]|nr:bifunctional phosphoglucose/phosphomannose isomerase [Candidatus Aenigmarchaeota archaeon]
MLDNVESMRKLDKFHVIDAIESFPEQCEEAIEMARQNSKNIKLKKPKSVAVCGMGGSGIAGDILAGLFPDRDIRVFKDYVLPNYVGKDYLVFIVSYSGNTEETISMFQQALKRRCKIIAISSGGEIERMAVENRIRHIKIPEGLPPRFAFAYLFFPLIVILAKLKFINKQNLDRIVKHLKETRDEITTSIPTKNNPAKRIALKLFGSVPIIQGFGKYSAVAYRAKSQFNENSKLPAFHEIYPEMNHNSILGWEHAESLTKSFGVVVLRDEHESEKIRKRIEFTKKVLKKSARCVVEIWSTYPLDISRVLSTMYVLDFVSVYLGLLRGEDPGENSLLTQLKNILKK